MTWCVTDFTSHDVLARKNAVCTAQTVSGGSESVGSCFRPAEGKMVAHSFIAGLPLRGPSCVTLSRRVQRR